MLTIFCLLVLLIFFMAMSLGLNLWNRSATGGGSGVSHASTYPTYAAALQHNPGGVTPFEFLQKYKLAQVQEKGHYGAGETIALFENNPYFSPTAYRNFCRAFSKTQTNLADPVRISIFSKNKLRSITPSDNANTTNNETQLDVEWTHVVAPKANILVINTKTDSLAEVQQVFANQHVTVASSSISRLLGLRAERSQLSIAPDKLSGWYGSRAFYKWIKNYPFFVSSGDKNGFVSVATVDPSSVIVGGINENQTFWSNEGQGYAYLLAKSSVLQRMAGNYSIFRASPDVVWLAGEPGVFESLSDGWIGDAGGTSLAAPLWAGLWALASNVHKTATHSPLPNNANAVLYQDAMRFPQDFHKPGHQYWVKSYGLGIPNADKLVMDLGLHTFSTNPVQSISGILAYWPSIAFLILSLITLVAMVTVLYKGWDHSLKTKRHQLSFLVVCTLIIGFVLRMFYSDFIFSTIPLTGNISNRIRVFMERDFVLAFAISILLFWIYLTLDFVNRSFPKKSKELIDVSQVDQSN